MAPQYFFSLQRYCSREFALRLYSLYIYTLYCDELCVASFCFFNKKRLDSIVTKVDMITGIGMIKKTLFGFSSEGFN